MTDQSLNAALEPFEREERFIVIKRKRLSGDQEADLRMFLNRQRIGTVECVVVESDWPEYETVWKMIEDRVTGRTPAKIDATSLDKAMREATHTGLEHRYFPEPASVAGKVEITQADRDAARHFARTMHQTGGRPVSGFNLIAGKMNPEDSIPMILHCPTCGTRHIDEQGFAEVPHHTHACQGCGLVWRPAKVNTHGVRFLPGYKNQDQTNEVTHD